MLDMETLNAVRALLVHAATIATVAFVPRLAYDAPLTVPLAFLTMTCVLAVWISPATRFSGET